MSEDFDDIYGSTYLSADDIKKPFVTVIEQVVREEVGQEKKKKAVLYVRGSKKAIVVNKTNATNLSNAFGKDFDSWINRRITVKVEPTSFAGRPTKGLRIYPAAEEAPALKKPSSDDFNDSIDM